MHHTTSLLTDARFEPQVFVFGAIVGRGIDRKMKAQVDKPSSGEWIEIDIF
jgi:hypothetical protein